MLVTKKEYRAMLKSMEPDLEPGETFTQYFSVMWEAAKEEKAIIKQGGKEYIEI